MLTIAMGRLLLTMDMDMILLAMDMDMLQLPMADMLLSASDMPSSIWIWIDLYQNAYHSHG